MNKNNPNRLEIGQTGKIISHSKRLRNKRGAIIEKSGLSKNHWVFETDNDEQVTLHYSEILPDRF